MITILQTTRQHNVLVLDHTFAIEQSIDFQASMFDVVYIMNDKADEVEAILADINPVTSNKCSYKPLFVSKSVEGKMGLYDSIIDGYTNDIDDPRTLDIVDKICETRKKHGVREEMDSIDNTNMFLVRVYRYLISRDYLRMEPVLGEKSSIGYSMPIFELFHGMGYFHLREHFIFEQIMCERGYFKPVAFINRIHLCPKCQHSHLMYIESCPRCSSSQVAAEEVIHHFRCANISPEHTYNKGGQLVCPKCSKILRHIGVDYDRPASVFTCKQCDNSFLTPSTKAICTYCHTESEVTKLVPHDVNIIEITKEGIREMVSNNIGFAIYTDFYDNYLDYDRFVNRVRLLIEQHKNNTSVEDLIIGKIWLINKNGETEQLNGSVVGAACKLLTNHKVSVANNIIYVNNIILDKDLEFTYDSFRIELSEAIRRIVTILSPGMKICCTCTYLDGKEENMNRFILDLNYISQTPDDTCLYEDYATDAVLGSENLLEKAAVDIVDDEPVKTVEETIEEEADGPYKWLRYVSKFLIILISVLVVVLVYIFVRTQWY